MSKSIDKVIVTRFVKDNCVVLQRYSSILHLLGTNSELSPKRDISASISHVSYYSIYQLSVALYLMHPDFLQLTGTLP